MVGKARNRAKDQFKEDGFNAELVSKGCLDCSSAGFRVESAETCTVLQLFEVSLQAVFS